MSHSEDFGHSDEEKDESHDDIEAVSEPDNDYYSFLHVPRTATQEEIIAAYKKLSRLYHPDKHRDPEKKEYAGSMFAKLNQAYGVLNDPHKRALYDCLGKDGISPDVLAVIPRTKTPKEIRDEYERLAKEREERELLRRTNPTSRVTMRINATDLFERYMYDEYYDDVMTSSWPVLEVTEISFGQTIDAPLTVTEKLTLSGEVSSHNGRGDGSITCLIKRVTSDSSSHELHASIGNGPNLGGKYHRKLNTRTFLTMSGSMQLYRGSVTPGLQISLANHLSRRLKGYLTYSASYRVEETEDAIALETQQSSMSTMVVYDGEKYYFMYSLQFGIPQTYLIMTFARKLTNPVGKLRLSVKLGTFGAIIEYGIERKITKQSTLAATMSVGAVGVVLKIRLNRASQTYNFPIHLSDEILFQPLFYGTVTPMIAWYVLKKLILEPWEAKESKKVEKQHKMEENARLAAARKDAAQSVELMRERYLTICSNETDKNGLVIIVALYGKIFNEMQELLPEVNTILETGSKCTEPPMENVDSQLLAVPEIVNVTVPIQCLVEEESRLILYEGSKSGLAGFYDPCDESDKHLLIQYLYRGQIHQAQITDREQLRCPRMAHQLET